MINKTYEELIKEKEYQDIANILYNNLECRKDNRKLLITYYRNIYGLTLDEAFRRNDIPNYQSIERKARVLKAKNGMLAYNKNDQVSEYKQIALETPIAVKLF